jgi:hypothetical protein
MATALFVLWLRKASSMKASIVYNKNNEPRVFIELQNFNERELLRNVDALKLIVVGETNGQLADLAFEIVNEKPDESDQFR